MRPSRRLLAAVAAVTALAVVAPADAGLRVVEKDINLDITRRVADRLRAAGVDVELTRRSDRTLRPSDRTGLANRRRPDLFVSIHNNASYSGSVRGTEIYRSIRRDGSRAAGRAIRRAFRSEFGSDRRNVLRTRRGCCGDYYFQLRESNVPAVLVEGAYLTNPTEGRKLATARYRRRIADAIADGILRFQRSLASGRAPRKDPGTVVRGTLLPPSRGTDRALGATRIRLRWDAHPTVRSYRVYRDGRLIARASTGEDDPLVARRLEFVDRWAAPGERYRYEIRSVRKLEDGIYAESDALVLVERTPAISVVLDAGHGGRDPGAIARY